MHTHHKPGLRDGAVLIACDVARFPQGYKKISPFFIPYAITNMGGALLGIDIG